MGEKPKVKAKAIHGKATWVKASPTKDILLTTMKEPRYPAAAATATPTKIKKIKFKLNIAFNAGAGKV